MGFEYGFEAGDIPTSPMAECKIRTAGNMRHAQRTDQHVPDKLFRAEMGEFNVKRDLKYMLHTMFRERFCPNFWKHEAEWRVLRAEQLSGMRIKRHDRKRLVRLCGFQGLEQMRMTEMHAVKIAKCRDSTTGISGNVTPVCMQCHDGRLNRLETSSNVAA